MMSSSPAHKHSTASFPIVTWHMFTFPTTHCSDQGFHFDQKVLIMNISLVEVMDVLNRSMTNQYNVLLETVRQSQLASKEHHLSNAKSCDGKDPKEFGTWLDDVSRLATISSNDSTNVALTTSKGTLHKYISELVFSGMHWLSMKAHLQENFLECRGSNMAKHKLTQL